MPSVDAPVWLLALLRAAKPAPATIPVDRPGTDNAASAYGQAALDAEVARVAGAPQGQRNGTLNAAAYALGQLVAGGVLDSAMPFDFDGKPIRAITDADGNPWFVAKDVCDILGYANPTDAVGQHCKCPELLKASKSLGLEIPARGLTIINEPDLYRLIMKSTKPEAERFERKVMEEILPAIRKHGGYLTLASSWRR